ncbi:MAG: hypothetical protein WBE58_22590 [Verrucomicrobiales bacterium]
MSGIEQLLPVERKGDGLHGDVFLERARRCDGTIRDFVDSIVFRICLENAELAAAQGDAAFVRDRGTIGLCGRQGL